MVAIVPKSTVIGIPNYTLTRAAKAKHFAQKRVGFVQVGMALTDAGEQRLGVAAAFA
jgi:hypothetical protein